MLVQGVECELRDASGRGETWRRRGKHGGEGVKEEVEGKHGGEGVKVEVKEQVRG